MILKKKVGSIELLGNMAESAPKTLAVCLPQVRPAAQQAAQVSQGGREEGDLETRRWGRESQSTDPNGLRRLLRPRPNHHSEVTIRSLVTELKPDVP